MESQFALDLGRNAILQCLLIAGPILIIVLVVGLFMSVLQTVTNVHDYSVAFIPKLIAVVIALTLCLPWMMGKLADYSHSTFSQVPVVRQVDR